METGPQRLQKILARAGIGSRRACDRLVASGCVTVDGIPVTRPGTCADPAVQRIEVNGRPVLLRPRHTYLVDKPRGIICTSSDPAGRTTIVDWARQAGVPASLRLYTVGRLDYDSEGLILLTNDGDLAQSLAHPRHHVEKEYRVWTDHSPSPRQMEQMLRGVEESGERLRALSITPDTYCGPRASPSCCVVLGEGRNRHIRRMMDAVGLTVRRLRRIRIGPLGEDALRGREIRELTTNELDRL